MIEIIYKQLMCGGVGYSPVLYRVGRKYYTVRGDVEGDNIKKLAAMDFPKKRDGHTLFMKHRNDNIVTAGEFLQIITILSTPHNVRPSAKAGSNDT